MFDIQKTNLVKVFISSNCDSKEAKQSGNAKYGVMRKSIKILLESTAMCEVYIFEEGTATSYSVIPSYMNPLEDSDLVIVIVDNKDGIGQGTQKEINRINAIGKKCIYVFCDERQKESTELEKQLLKSTANPRYLTVSDFSDIPQMVYKSVLGDILGIYTSYCRGRIDYTNDEQGAGEIESGEVGMPVANDSDISMELLSGFSYTRYIVKKEAGVTFDEVRPMLDSDKRCANLLGTIIGSPITDAPDFSYIKQDIKRMHKGNVQKLVGIRYEAVEAYFAGKLDECIGKLEEAVEFIQNCKNIPKWMLKDVAIDLRNVQLEINNEKGIVNYQTHGQSILDEDNETIYYPVIDRIVSEYNEGIIKARNNSSIQPSYMISWGGVDYTIEKAINAFVVAYYYGSITHMLLTRKRICNCLLGLVLEVRNHRMFMFTVRLLLLANEDKLLRKFLDSYGENTNNINSSDAEDLVIATSKQPLRLKRYLARESALRFFGYYYSDSMFQKETYELLNIVKECVANNYGVGLLIVPLLDAMKDTSYRFDEAAILEFIYYIFEMKCKLFYEDAFGFLTSVRFTKISKEEQKRYQEFLIEEMNNVEKNGRGSRVFQAAQTLRKYEQINHNPLDDAVRRNDPTFFSDTYSLNVDKFDDNRGWEYIKKYVEEIKKDNSIQGKGGLYAAYAYDPYLTISNILLSSGLCLDSSQIKALINVIRGTLFARTQLIEAKVRALELLCIIQLRQPSNRQIRKLYKEIRDCREGVFEGKDMIFDKGYGKINLSISICLLGAILKQVTETEIGVQLIEVQHSDIMQQITVLRFLDRIAQFELSNKLECVFSLLFQYLLDESYSENFDVRFYAVSTLSKIRDKKYREVCLERFVNIMDDETYKGKVGLLYRLNKEDCQNTKVKYIFDKGRIDTHYWVRMAAIRFDVV